MTKKTSDSPAQSAEIPGAARQGFSLWQRSILLLGSLGPLGRLPASGTCTVILVGIPWFWISAQLPIAASIGITLAFSFLAVWVHDVGDRILGEKDSSLLVWDEVAGFMVATIGLPFSWSVVIPCVLLQRTLDITKAFPADWIEREAPGGWGVVGDDIVAGAYTCAILHLALRAFGG